MNKKKFKVFATEHCSEHFQLAFCRAGATSVDCTCGRTHFVNMATEHDQLNSFKRLEKLSQGKPSQYIPHDTTSVRYGIFDDVQFVFDCPCNYARVIENILFDEAICIMEYFDRVTTEEKRLIATLSAKVQQIRNPADVMKMNIYDFFEMAHEKEWVSARMITYTKYIFGPVATLTELLQMSGNHFIMKAQVLGFKSYVKILRALYLSGIINVFEFPIAKTTRFTKGQRDKIHLMVVTAP